MARKHRRGLTLLEVILVLGLATLILYAVSMAIDFHLRTLDVRRSNVEEAQVARAVLNMIANDLRSTVPEYRMDTKGIEQMLAGLGGSGGDGGTGGSPDDGSGGDQNNNGAGNNSGGNNSGGNNSGGNNSGGNNSGGNNSGGNNSGGNNSGSGNRDGTGGNQDGTGGNGGPASGGGNPSGGSSGGSGTDENGGTENTENLAGSTTLPPTPGLYGNQYQLQLDVSRLPRPDQYMTLNTQNQLSLPQIPSDVKTVTYFVQDGTTIGSNVKDPFAFGGSTTDQPATGLIRREVDRAVVQFAQTNGTSEALLRTGDLVAREVTAIQFQYFDGLEWLPQWDSAAKKGLPVAIEILVEITPAARITPGAAGAAVTASQPVLYRLVVQMPLGEPAELESTDSTSSGMENLGL